MEVCTCHTREKLRSRVQDVQDMHPTGGNRCVLRCQASFALQNILLSEGRWVTPESGCEEAFSSCSALDRSSVPLRASLRRGSSQQPLRDNGRSHTSIASISGQCWQRRSSRSRVPFHPSWLYVGQRDSATTRLLREISNGRHGSWVERRRGVSSGPTAENVVASGWIVKSRLCLHWRCFGDKTVCPRALRSPDRRRQQAFELPL